MDARLPPSETCVPLPDPITRLVTVATEEVDDVDEEDEEDPKTCPICAGVAPEAPLNGSGEWGSAGELADGGEFGC